MNFKRLLLLICLLAPTAAHAQDEALEAAKTHFENGQDLFADGKYTEAAGEFQAGVDIKGFPAFLFNEAVCYEKLKDNKKAIALYKQYLSLDAKARDSEDVQKKIDYLQGEIDRQNRPPDTSKPPPPPPPKVVTKGIVVVESKPPGATVYLDDKNQPSVGETPWSGSLEGKHTIFLEAKGYKSEKKDIEPRPDKMTSLYIAMSEEHYLAFVDVRSNIPAADVYIDDVGQGKVGSTPYMGNITPQKHKIIVTKEGYTTFEQEMDLEAGKAYPIEAKLEKAPIGFVAIRGDLEGASVKLDGKVVCTAQPCRFKADQGEHHVTVAKPGKKPYTRTLHIQEATESDLSVQLAEKQGHLDAIWNFAFAAAFVGGGIGLGIAANGVHDDLQKDINAGMPPVLPSDSRFLKGKLFAIGADVLFTVGGITAITGIVSLLKEKGPPSSATLESRDLSIAPAVGPGYEGVEAEVRW